MKSIFEIFKINMYLKDSRVTALNENICLLRGIRKDDEKLKG